MSQSSTLTPPDASASEHAREIAEGKRFPFGKNWRAFIETMSEDAIAEAMKSLKSMLKRDSLEGVRFLDIGSGSGLFSLAAHRLGAIVTSFDFDPDSVGCTQELRHRYGGDSATSWKVLQGSVLDRAFMESLGTYEIVYSWGVLHHTGAMWPAIWNAVDRVQPGGMLFIAIYNDQGAWSHRWAKIKRFYCSSTFGKAVVCGTVIPYWVVRGLAADVVWGRNPLHRYTQYGKNRGMSAVRDWFDWLGGYPFEFATPEALIMPLQDRGFRLVNLVTQRGTEGCIELVMRHEERPAGSGAG